jgi:DNA repair protein RadC
MKPQLKTIAWRFREVKSDYAFNKGDLTMRSPQDVVRIFTGLFAQQVKERFVVIWLSSANVAIGYEIITEGILNASLAHPREVFRGAIVATCASVIIAHNHPSGNTEPSTEDVQITKQIVEAGKIIGIPVHDHIIFADSTYTSFAERGLL